MHRQVVMTSQEHINVTVYSEQVSGRSDTAVSRAPVEEGPWGELRGSLCTRWEKRRAHGAGCVR